METTSKGTLIEEAVNRITADIISGRLEPEKKLQIANLKQRYGIGASPLREGLAQLSMLGFVVFDSRRGFRVTSISKEDLEDITALRKMIETEALRQAIRFGDDEWEVGIVAAFAHLERVVSRLESSGLAEEGLIEEKHKQYHAALLAACRSQRLLFMHDIFYDQALRYRHLMISQLVDPQDFLNIHKKLTDAILARKTEDACLMLTEHIDITLEKIYPTPSEPKAV